MSWFTSWWDSLTLLQQCFACVAVPATILLILQTVFLMFGFGSHDADNGEFDHGLSDANGAELDHGLDHSFEHEAHDGAHHGSGVRIFTVRGFVALFAVGGWIGIAMVDLGVSAVGSTLIAVACGVAALALVAWVFTMLNRMQESGNINPKNAVAQVARVYVRIPPRRSGTGKVTFTLQERFVEMDAVTDYEKEIPTDSMVQVVSVTGDVLVVRPL